MHFSWFGLDLHPVSDLDFNSRYMAVLQWNVTFRGVDAGSVSVYRFASRDSVCNLSKAAGSTFSCCRFVPAKDREDLVLTGADDGSVRKTCFLKAFFFGFDFKYVVADPPLDTPPVRPFEPWERRPGPPTVPARAGPAAPAANPGGRA